MATLLKPIAKYHEPHRHEALGLLWKLGWPDAHSNSGFGQNHPWSVIAEVIKYEPKKPINVTLDALVWLKTQLEMPESRKLLEGKTPVLRMLVGPCFDRTVEWSWWEGRQCHFATQFVSVRITMPIRASALSILDWIIENGSWLAALDALSALEPAIDRIYPLNTSSPSELAKLNEEWQPERLRGLVLYEKALKKHTQIAVCYKVRHTLKRIVRRDEDSSFATEARRILKSIPEDLALRTVVAVLSHDAEEIEDRLGSVWTEDDRKNVASLWNKRMREIAVELAAKFPEPVELHTFLARLTEELTRAGYHPLPFMLFQGMAEATSAISLALAREIIDAKANSPLAQAWPSLVEKNPAVDEAKRLELFQDAARASVAGASSAAVRALAIKSRQEQPLNEAEQRLLLEVAGRASDEESLSLLQLVEWCGDANTQLAADILKALPIRKIAPRMLSEILQALCPFRERKAPLAPAVVHAVVSQLDAVSDLGVFSGLRVWKQLSQQHPRAVYELLRERIARATAVKDGEHYSPIPLDFETEFSLSELSKEPDYSEICDELWSRVTGVYNPQSSFWQRLFKAVVMRHPPAWLARMTREIETSQSAEKLSLLVELLRFDGSLLIFRFPEIPRALLTKAKLLGGKKLFEIIREGLYRGCGPQTRAYGSGALDAELDYVESEAVKAAEAHANDELLGPFYRWIVEAEQKERLMHKMDYECEMSALD
jgi:hypothetical protein